MNILDKIVLHKQSEVAERKHTTSIRDLENAMLFQRPRVSLRNALEQAHASGIIAEFKRKSPSKGIINDKAEVISTTTGYESAGVSGLSILTDQDFFGGSGEDLMKAREKVTIPILRKDFIVDEYQIVEAKAMGADVILLIVACLSREEIVRFSSFAHSLDLEVLMEVHNREELDKGYNDHIDVVGVNNRNLKDFSVHIETSLALSEHIPAGCVKIAESGLSDPREVIRLKQVGFQGFLMGQKFMETTDPAAACKDFIIQLNKLSQDHALKKIS